MSGYGSVAPGGTTLALTGMAYGQSMLLAAVLLTVLGLALVVRMFFRRGKDPGDA